MLIVHILVMLIVKEKSARANFVFFKRPYMSDDMTEMIVFDLDHYLIPSNTLRKQSSASLSPSLIDEGR